MAVNAEVSNTESPIQILVPGVAIIKAPGIGTTVTFTLSIPEHPLVSVTFTTNHPISAKLAAGTDGFCNTELNPFGPVQL